MATTNTVSEPVPGILIYSFTALANGDTFDIDCIGADKILVQVTGGTFNSSGVFLSGSILGSSFAALIPEQDIPTGVAATAGQIAISAANTAIFRVQPTRYLRIAVSGGTGTGITMQVLIDCKVSV